MHLLQTNLIKGSWFEGYAKQVTIFDAMVSLDQFDGNIRGDLNKGPEYIIFKNGLQVKDFVRLGDYHSIYVILGDLEAESVNNQGNQKESGGNKKQGGGGTNQAWETQKEGFYYTVVEAMLNAGFKEEEIGKIGGGNYCRIFDAATNGH